MITKLKWLRAYFTRDILPATGNTIGKILYTSKNTTGRRIQYVVDLDANLMDVTTINAYPADQTTSPGAIVVTNDTTAPQTDKSLYGFNLGASLPTITLADLIEFNQTIDNDGTIDAINVLTDVVVVDYLGDSADADTSVNVDLTAVNENGLTLDTDTGAVTLDDNLVAGTYTLDYKISDQLEPSVYKTNTVTVIVDLPVMDSSVQAEFNQQIDNGALISVINVLTGVTVNGSAATTSNCTISAITENGLTLNTGTGAVTLDDNLTADTYTLDYKVQNTLNPTVFITGTITVIVDPV